MEYLYVKLNLGKWAPLLESVMYTPGYLFKQSAITLQVIACSQAVRNVTFTPTNMTGNYSVNSRSLFE